MSVLHSVETGKAGAPGRSAETETLRVQNRKSRGRECRTQRQREGERGRHVT